ncbi:MAG: nucleoside kinase [Lachnospiraceae bacterium]
MEQTWSVTIRGEKKEYKAGTTYQQIAQEYQKEYEDQILLVLFNNRLRELTKTVKNNGTLAFVTAADSDGKKAYRRSMTLLLQRAADRLWGKKGTTIKVLYSLGEGYYCVMEGKNKLSELELGQLQDEMRQMVQADLPIEKFSMNTFEAAQLFHQFGMTEKEQLFRYRRSSKVNLYRLDGYIDYYYGFMVPSTGYLQQFALEPYQDGFMMLFPGKDSKKVEPFQPSNKLFHTLRESREWSKMMRIGTVGSLNDAIAAGRIQDVILMQEALMERSIGKLAETIAQQKDKKFVMIAGPSSSGKTTFSHRLSTQLYAQGMTPHPIGLDDYYKNREETPLDEDGEYDFECLEAIDIELLNQNLTDLLDGNEIEMPTFNFKTGFREYKGNTLKLGEKDVLVIEGIHGLNDRLTYMLPKESKFKIYISALTQLNIDEHNCLSTTDGRLIRRIVRDARTRNTTAQETIARWYSVRRGEERNIFPFQEDADVMFNSALVYELAVLKIYAEPLLFHIQPDCPEYTEAKRLLKFLDYILPVPSDRVANNSILREFIGGSCFNV